VLTTILFGRPSSGVMRAGASDDAETTRLALAARGGDPVARDRFVRATQRDVWRFVAYLAGSRRPTT
jgi:RNA polymerase sigma-70 factor (ECF subfamily)